MSLELVPSKPRIKADIQEKVDLYIELHEKMSKVKKELQTLRDEIEPYMEDRKLREIKGTKGGKIEIIDTNRAPMNANFTTYDYEVVRTMVDPLTLEECTRKVIDKNLLEALSKLGKISKSVLIKAKVKVASTMFRCSG